MSLRVRVFFSKWIHKTFQVEPLLSPLSPFSEHFQFFFTHFLSFGYSHAALKRHCTIFRFFSVFLFLFDCLSVFIRLNINIVYWLNTIPLYSRFKHTCLLHSQWKSISAATRKKVEKCEYLECTLFVAINVRLFFCSIFFFCSFHTISIFYPEQKKRWKKLRHIRSFSSQFIRLD